MTTNEYLKNILHEILQNELDAMPSGDFDKHIADNDDLLLRWEIGDVSVKERHEIAEHLRHCPHCLKQIGEMLQTGVLELPRPVVVAPKVGVEPVRKRRRYFPILIHSGAACLFCCFVLLIIFGNPLVDFRKPDAASNTNSSGIALEWQPSFDKYKLTAESYCITLTAEEMPSVCIYEERLDGKLELIEPKQWSQHDAVNRFLETITIFVKPAKSNKPILRWTTDPHEAQWILTIHKNPIGFTLTKKGVYDVGMSGIEDLLTKGFSVFSPEPQPVDSNNSVGGVVEY